MKIAFIKPPATYADWYHRPQLGAGYLAAYLEEAGHTCRIFDSVFFGWNNAGLIEQVTEFAPDLAAFTAMTHEIAPAARVAGRLRENSGIVTVVGGCHLSALPRETLQEFPTFDFGIAGEGEHGLLGLVKRLQGDIPADCGVPGLVERTPAGPVAFHAPPPPLTGRELDDLPFPAFHLYYGNNRRALAGPEEEYPIISGRGCPYRCTFCMQALGRVVRHRSAEDICLEMEAAINNFGAHTFNFIDEIFLSDTPRTRFLLERLISSGLSRRVRWSGLTRANLVNRDLVCLARRAGCFRLEMGVESGDDAILRRINKGITVAQVRAAADCIKAAGIELNTYFILGHPGETPDSIDRTRQLAMELNPDNIALGIMVPYPGTEIYRIASRGEGGYRLLSHDWERYDKYGQGVLEIAGFSHRQLQREQRRIITSCFLHNGRYLDLFRYAWKRRRALYYFLRRS